MEKINILCGASIFAKEVVKEAGIHFKYICDSDRNKVGHFYEDIEIISYQKVIKLIKQTEVNIYLANRYISETVKKFEYYFTNSNFNLYAFVSNDLKKIIKINSITDYYENSTIIKRTFLNLNYLLKCRNINNNEILIFTMRKVGTLSIKNALDISMGIDNLYLHSIYNYSGLRKKFVNDENLHNGPVSLYYKKILNVVKDNIQNGKPLKVITVVREPIARNISLMFHDLQLILGINEDISNIKNEKYAYTEIFEDLYYQTIDNDYLLNWFDIELKSLLGIDIYKYNFNKEKGYNIIQKNNIKLLIIKFEKLNECVNIIREFCNLDKFELIKTNSSSEYWYSPLYQVFKSKFIPNIEHLEKLYKSKFMNYFYSDKEIEYFYKKWRKI